MRGGPRALKYYPIALALCDKPVIIIGGGRVAQRKAGLLLKAGAKVKVISPVITSALERSARAGRIEWARRRVRRKDIEASRIIVAATDDRAINKKISAWSKSRDRWINVADRSELSDFISPAVFSSKEAIVAVYTDGADPVLSRDLKNFLKERWDDFLRYRHRLQDGSL